MKRKTPYSLVAVNSVCLESVISARRGQGCTVGVDVAKGDLVACLYWPDRSFERPWRIASPGQVPLLVGHLKKLSAACPVVVAMESSGVYGDEHYKGSSLVLLAALSAGGRECGSVRGVECGPEGCC